MSSFIFHLAPDGSLHELEESAYESEDLLQRLLATHSELLAGDQIDDQAPRRWLLVRREMGVTDRQEGSGRWSLDHLFVDQDGVPTLVEVKRSSDTRLRREVVGQLLEYAANAARYWPTGEIRAEFEARCERDAEDPECALEALLGRGADVEGYWKKVGDNLALGRLRLLFVADEIPHELQRIVEYLNEQMVHTQVLAVEIKQFVGKDERRTLVPRVIGQTAAARDLKGNRRPPRKEPWTRETFLEKMRSQGSQEAVPIVEKILDWAVERGLTIEGGRGAVNAGLYFGLADRRSPFGLYEDSAQPRLFVQFDRSLFRDIEARRPIAEAFNALPGIEIDPRQDYTGIGFDRLGDPATLEGVLRAMACALESLEGGGELQD